MTNTILKKIEIIEKKFTSLKTPEEKYLHLINMGRELPTFKEEWKVDSKRVLGCQSTLYLHSELQNEKMFYRASSDALISAGLAALLIFVYDEESPETVLRTPPNFLHTLGIYASLSPNRSNGLSSLYKKIAEEALKSCQKIFSKKSFS